MRISHLALMGLILCACKSWRDDDESDEEHATTQSSAGGGDSTSSTREASMTGAGKNLTADDLDFIEQAAYGGMFEVKSSELALDEQVSSETRSFAQMMVDDHGKANRELEGLASRKGFHVPVGLDADHQRKLDKLATLDGSEFERAYLDAQREGHDAAIELFERAAKDCKDAELKSFASRTLPTLRKHRAELD